MSYGGYWDKVGNQFETRWALRQLVLLTSPSSDIESLEWEPVGDDEPGADLWVNRKNGTRECSQSKLGNKGKPSWSMADLRREKIPEHLRLQIGREPSRHRYCLVSGVPALSFERLCNEARDSRDSETFLESQVRPIKKLYRELSEFCDALNLKICDPTDREFVWSLLQSSRFKLFRDDEDHAREMADQLESRVSGYSSSLLGDLESWLRQQLRRKIDLAAVALFLVSHGCTLVQGATDRFNLAARDLSKKRLRNGGLLRLEAEINLLQRQIKSQIGEQTQVQILAGRWRLVRRIGAGGFAEVWQGEDQEAREPEREPVAVKILLPEKANDPVLVERFYHGGHMASSIMNWRMPRIIVKPMEMDGRHFYVMEYFEGTDLSIWLARQRLPMQEKIVSRNDPEYQNAAWMVLSSVGETLSLLHREGLVHGDVKPKNILISRQGTVMLCDFDLIHLESTGGENVVAIGTLPYMAPEVFAFGNPSALSDQYSLALIAVTLIQGSEPNWIQASIHSSNLLQELSCSIAAKKNLGRALASEARKRFETIEDFLSNLGPEAFKTEML